METTQTTQTPVNNLLPTNPPTACVCHHNLVFVRLGPEGNRWYMASLIAPGALPTLSGGIPIVPKHVEIQNDIELGPQLYVKMDGPDGPESFRVDLSVDNVLMESPNGTLIPGTYDVKAKRVYIRFQGATEPNWFQVVISPKTVPDADGIEGVNPEVVGARIENRMLQVQLSGGAGRWFNVDLFQKRSVFEVTGYVPARTVNNVTIENGGLFVQCDQTGDMWFQVALDGTSVPNADGRDDVSAVVTDADIVGDELHIKLEGSDDWFPVIVDEPGTLVKYTGSFSL